MRNGVLRGLTDRRVSWGGCKTAPALITLAAGEDSMVKQQQQKRMLCMEDVLKKASSHGVVIMANSSKRRLVWFIHWGILIPRAFSQRLMLTIGDTVEGISALSTWS